MLQQRTQILVIGAGYAGMLATVRLAAKTNHKNVQITLINPLNSFIERLRLHQYAANQPVKQRSISGILRGTGVRFVEAQVTSINIHQREVVAKADSGEQRLPYDYLLYTPGSTIEQDSIPGIRQFAYTLTPRGEHSAEALKSALPELNKRGGKLVIVGGGPTGIEAAAEFAESYPGLHVSLVTRGEPADAWGGRIQSHIVTALLRLGVSIQNRTIVSQVRAHEIITSKGDAIPFDVCLWAGGFVASPLALQSGLDVNEHNQLLIDLCMRSISHPEIYAAGDSGQPVEKSGVHIRMAAYTAAITGAHAADNLSNVINGRPQKPLNFAYLGQAIALGRHDAMGFNNFPDDKPKWPSFSGELGVLGREFFVGLLANLPEFERRVPGIHFWPGRGKAGLSTSPKSSKRGQAIRNV